MPAGKVAGDVIEVSALAVDAWGNGEPGGVSNWVDVVLPASCVFDEALGRFTGGGHQIRVGEARVTRGLTIHCDLLLSNNLEVNWGGKQFHMTEHLTTVECSDDPDILEDPPPAPLDTLIGVGTGRYNGVDGYTIEFTKDGKAISEPFGIDELVVPCRVPSVYLLEFHGPILPRATAWASPMAGSSRPCARRPPV